MKKVTFSRNKKLKQMEQSDDDGLPLPLPLPTLVSSNYPWLIVQNLEQEDEKGGEHILYSIHDPISHYRYRIPELAGRLIRACFHGWMILSKHPHHLEWSLWNPLTSNFIRLPPLPLPLVGDSDDIEDCCLSSPPGDSGSILLLTLDEKPNIVFCRLDTRRSWTQMSYAKQLTTITGDPDSSLLEPTCCNGTVYAWADCSDPPQRLIQIHIAVKEKEVVISLLPFLDLPDYCTNGDSSHTVLKGSCTQLFTIELGIANDKLVDVYPYKLDMSRQVWVEMEDLKDTAIFLDMGGHDSVYSSPAIASELSGYIFLHHSTNKVMYSYNVKDKTISMSSIHCIGLPPTSENLSMTIWGMPEFRLQQADNGETKCKGDDMVATATNDEETNETGLLDIPIDVLEMMMKFCVGIEYLNFRATCKLCRSAAPMIRWSNERMRLQTYSLVSPWLMVLDKDQGMMTFTDPMFGEDKYYIKVSPELFDDGIILCSRFGWLLFLIEDGLAFFNPFTSDIRKLPEPGSFDTFCFSAPPTSPDCMVVGFSPTGHWNVCIHFVAGEPIWHTIGLNFCGHDPRSYAFPTCCGRDVYVMLNDGGLEVFRDISADNFSTWETIVGEADAPKSCSGAEYFQSKCDQHHLLVIVGEFGESVEVFKLNDCTKEWEKIDGLGKHVIYIYDATCVCMDAKTPEMENKIYFPRFHPKNKKIVFYCMETHMYYTFNGRNVEQYNVKGLFETKKHHIYTQAWIEPTWS